MEFKRNATSFREKKEMFEVFRLEKQADGRKETNAVANSPPPAPPKPMRTFAQLEYGKSKGQYGKRTYFLEQSKSKVHLSHEYEQIYASFTTPAIEDLRRSASCEELYSVPCKIKSDQPMPVGDYSTSLYYCVSEVPCFFPANSDRPVPKPRKSKRLLFKSVDGDERSSTDSHNGYATIHTNVTAPKSHHVIMRSEVPTMVDVEEDSVSLGSCTADADQRTARARMTRRKTLMHYDQQEIAFKCRQVPQLFETVVIVELQPNDHSNPLFTGKFMPALCYRFPFDHRRKGCPSTDPALLASLPCLCYPDLSRATAKLPTDHEDEYFVITTTDQFGDRKFAFCCRFVPTRRASDFCDENDEHADERSQIFLPSLPHVICVVTPVQAVQFYSDFTRECLKCLRISIKTLSCFLSSSFNVAMPRSSQKLAIRFTTSNENKEREVTLVNRNGTRRCNGLHYLLMRLNVQNFLIVFASLLSERRVLMVGDCVTTVTKIIQACAAMLAPFEWPHTLIPVVPDSHVQLCFSPTPYLIGILRSNLHELKQLLISDSPNDDGEEYILIYDLDYGIIKERDFSGRSITENILLSSSHVCYRFFPSRMLRTLKNKLKSAYSKKEGLDNSPCNKHARSLSNNTLLPAHSDVDGEVSDALLECFARLLGPYRDFIVKQQDGKYSFLKEQYLRSQHVLSTRSLKSFLRWFVETGIFQIWMRKRIEIFNETNKQFTYDESMPRKHLLTCEDDSLDSMIHDHERILSTSAIKEGNARRFLHLVTKKFNFWMK